MKYFKTRGLLTAAGAALSLMAAADPVSYSFTGNVTSDEADRGYQTFAGSFSFDSGALNLISDPSGSTGAYSGAGWGLSLAFDGGAQFDFSDSLFMTIGNDLSNSDQWGWLAQGSLGTVSATLFDFSMAALTGSGLPLRDGGFTLADFGWSEFRWESPEGMLQAQLSSLTCSQGCSAVPGDPGTPSDLPEPGSLALALLALCLLPRPARLRKDQ